MSVERDLLGRWHNGDLLPEEYMKLMKETKELIAQPEQEPVAYLHEGIDETGETVRRIYCHFYEHANLIPLYTAPPKREPIEDGELEVWYSQHTWAMDEQEYTWGFRAYMAGCRDAEKAHGIGGGE